MKVGFYKDFSHLGGWNWREVLGGRAGLSGTDGSFLRVAHGLAEDSEWGVTLLTPSPGDVESATNLSQVAVGSLYEAVKWTERKNLDVLVFNNSHTSEVKKGIRQAERVGQDCVVWAQNGPSKEDFATEYSKLKSIRRLICVSNVHADYFRDHPIFEKIEVIYNPVDISWEEKSYVSRKEGRVCYVGAITREKGFQNLAEIWTEITSKYGNAELVVLGSALLYDRDVSLGPLKVGEEDFEKECIIPYLGDSRKEAKKKNVFFRGLVSTEELKKELRSAQVGVVNPNTTGSFETFCVSAVEMQCAGLPVIGGRRGGLLETVNNGETGILVNSKKELVSAICELISNPKKARVMGKIGRKRASNRFDQKNIISKWKKSLKRVEKNKHVSNPKFRFKRAGLKGIIKEIIRIARYITGI